MLVSLGVQRHVPAVETRRYAKTLLLRAASCASQSLEAPPAQFHVLSPSLQNAKCTTQRLRSEPMHGRHDEQLALYFERCLKRTTDSC